MLVNLIIKVLSFNTQSKKVCYTYKRKYDKKNNLTEEITYKNGEEAYKSVYSGFKKFTYTVDDSKK